MGRKECENEGSWEGLVCMYVGWLVEGGYAVG